MFHIFATYPCFRHIFQLYTRVIIKLWLKTLNRAASIFLRVPKRQEYFLKRGSQGVTLFSSVLKTWTDLVSIKTLKHFLWLAFLSETFEVIFFSADKMSFLVYFSSLLKLAVCDSVNITQYKQFKTYMSCLKEKTAKYHFTLSVKDRIVKASLLLKLMNQLTSHHTYTVQIKDSQHLNAEIVWKHHLGNI